MKKVGYFFFAFLPFIIVIGIQFAASFFMIGISGLFGLYHNILNGNPVFSMSAFMKLWMDMNFNTVIMIIYSLMSICLFALWYQGNCGGRLLIREQIPFSRTTVAGIILLVPGAQFMSSILCSIIAAVFPEQMEKYEELMETAGLTGNITLLMLVYSVLLAPVCEELVFRGVTMNLFQRAVPFWMANLLQAFLFGCFHMNFVQGCYAFVLGIILGYVCKRGRSIYCSIFFHMIFNLWGTLLPELITEDMNSTLVGFLMIIGMIASLTIGTILFQKNTDEI